MQTKTEYSTALLPLNLNFFVKKLIEFPKIELKFWCHLMNHDYTLDEELRLLEYLEINRYELSETNKALLTALLGGLYVFTNNAYKNPRRGLNLLKEAAVLNNSFAQNALGEIAYAKKNYPLAQQCFEMAVAQNNPMAMNNLALMHQYKQISPSDVLKAALLFRKASILSYKTAQFNLQLLASFEPQNLQLQYHFYMASMPSNIFFLLKKAPQLISECLLNDSLLSTKEKRSYFSNQEVKACLSDCHPLFDKIVQSLKQQHNPETSTPIRHQQTQVKKPISAEELNKLGRKYQDGIGVSKDYKQAVTLYEQAAAQDYSPALCNLAMMYQKGDGVAQNIAKAKNLLEQAIALNNSSAMNNLGYMYQHGQGLPQDWKEASRLYKMAEAMNDPVAISNLGCMQYWGQGTPVNLEKAVIYFRKSWQLSCAEAKQNLEKMRERLPNELVIQYHCAMALCPHDLNVLFEKSPQLITEIIFNDPLLTEDEKERLLTKQYERDDLFHEDSLQETTEYSLSF